MSDLRTLESGQHELSLKGNMSWWTMDSKDLFEREVQVIELLKKSRVARPRVLGLDARTRTIFFEKLKGCPVGSMTEPCSQTFFCIGKELLKIHNTPIAHEEASSSLPRVGGPDVDIKDRVLLHGDFHANNVMVDLDTASVTGILDWEEAAIGPRGIDVASFLRSLPCLFEDDGHNVASTMFLRGYGLDPATLDLGRWDAFITARNKRVSDWMVKTLKTREVK
jgi:aminoglycoside phosphotransferase (APT) family kinase protein